LRLVLVFLVDLCDKEGGDDFDEVEVEENFKESLFILGDGAEGNSVVLLL